MSKRNGRIGAVSLVGVLAWLSLATPARAQFTISANPPSVNVPAGQTQGKTTLTWDAGPTHRFAEIWVSVSGGDPVKLFEMRGNTQGKGSLEVTVEKGKRHRFILTDNGVELATVDVLTVKSIGKAKKLNDVGQSIDEVVASGYVGDPQTAPFLYFEWPRKQGEFTLGKFTGKWMNNDAEYDMKAIEARRDGALIAHGFIKIKATGELHRFWVEQYKDKSIRMIRYLEGTKTGKTQVGHTHPPEKLQDGGTYYANVKGDLRNQSWIRTHGPGAEGERLMVTLIIPAKP
jgi:hypothetical protein